MRKLIYLLKLLSFVLSFLSLILLISALSTDLTFDAKTELDVTLNNIYNSALKYSEVYRLCLIVSAFWITLRQLRISQENQARNFKQIEFIQNDILDKRNKEIRAETLNQVKYFQNEIQESIEALINDHLPNSFPIIWRNLQENPISENLYQHHHSFYDKMTALDSRNKNKVNLILRKIDSFSALFIHANLDSDLAFKIIGDDFLKQTELLLGVVSYFRSDEKSTYCTHLLQLKSKWSNLN